MSLINEGKLFFGAAIPLGTVAMIYPLTVKEIVGMGVESYQKYVGLFILTEEILKEQFKNKGDIFPEDMTVFEYLLVKAKMEDSFFIELKQAFSTFLRENVIIHIDLKRIEVGKVRDRRFIDEDLFFDFQNIIRVQNNRDLIERPDPNEDPMAKKFRLRRAEVELAKNAQANKEDKEGLSFESSLSCLCAYNIGVTHENIGQLPYYTFHELLARAREKEKYELDIQSLLAGASSKKIKPKYWVRNLKN